MSRDHGATESGFGPRELTTRYGRLAVPDTESDLIGRFLFRYGEWAWLESVFAASVIPDGARVLDVGAFAGTFGLGVAQSRPLGFLCFVEANPVVAPLLKRNVTDKTHCPSMVLEALVAGPEARAGTGHSQSGNLGSMSFSVGDDPDTPGATRAVTLADLRAEHGAFDLIKLDIEGMELEALRGDADFLANGKTTLWIEANEDPGSLEVARMLLSWNLELFYFAFPAFNPNNFNGDPESVFPFAFEAGLLAAPATSPSLSPELKDAGCILKPVRCVDDLKNALWRTPRWGMTEWESATTTEELAALAGRSIRGEAYAEFLASGAVVAPGAKATIWQRLETAQAELQDALARLSLVEEELQSANTSVAERLNQLEAERLRREQIEATLDITATLAADRLNQLEAEHLRRKEIAEILHRTTALAAERLDQLQSTRQTLNIIRGSTVWRFSAPLRAFVGRQPALHAVLSKTAATAGSVLRRCRRSGKASMTPASADLARAGSTGAVNSDHREAVRPYFDAAYYLAVNRDVVEAGIDPLDHFLQQGWREGRAPGPVFDVAYYLEANQDVVAAGINPVLHYIWAGKAEGRVPRRPLNVERQCLAGAVSPRARAADWTGAIDRSVPLSPAALAAALSEGPDAAGTIVSVSHDDYAANFGGIQNVIANEQRTFAASGWRYLHVSPAAPLPMLADYGPAADYRLRLRLNGRAIGVARFPNFASVLAASRDNGTKLAFIFHHLLGHVPELLATLPVEADGVAVVWVHDFFTLCPSFNLMRNDVKFCGAPPADSAACTVCAFGPDRHNHVLRMRTFFEMIHPMVLTPSAVTLNFWQRRGVLPHTGTAVVPPARLIMAEDSDLIATPNEAPLRVAHLGGVSMHKGWPVFEQLAFAHANDRRYEFYHLGLEGSPSSRYIHDPVWVSPEQPNAMIEAVVRHRIDVVICWSLSPETFCFTVHEALAGGAFVVARRAAGNVWPAVQANAYGQGCAIDDEADLFRLFENGGINTLVARASRFRGTLRPGGGTTEFLLNDRTAPTALLGTLDVYQ